MKYLLKAAHWSLLLSLVLGTGHAADEKASLKLEYPGKVIDCQGIAAVRPRNQERWTPLETGMLLDQGDWIRTEVRGPNAVQIRLANQDRIVLGPGSLLELSDEKNLSLLRGEAEVTPVKDSQLTVALPKDVRKTFRAVTILRVTDKDFSVLEREPNWLKYFKGAVTHESMGALVAKVDGRDVPLTLGYHKVTVDIRDQIARTVIEESFVNHTDATLEGVFQFPLPQDASISGFAMWIGDQLVEADVVEKQRAREIYETILREKRDPGLLEWSGGNIFKARVYPIFAHSEKRIKITYTQVLPMNGSQYHYSYALQSEMLRQNPLRELAVTVNVFSEVPLSKVLCPTHSARISQAQNSARVEFAAQEYTPTQDFEVEVDVGKSAPQTVLIPHRRGDDGYFLLTVNPPEPQRSARALLADGPPLDLLVLVDTSASIDREQRKAQDRFLGFLFGSLGQNDRFRLVAADVETAWFRPDPNAPTGAGLAPTEQNVAQAMDFLAGRVSLGWTDLGKTFAEVFKAAGPNTQIIYLGDGIDTSKDSDPGAIVKLIQRIYAEAGGKGAVHVVATSSSFEPATVKALAGLGGGSVRRLEGEAPERSAALGLLDELTRPRIRNMKVEFKGLRAARVYPEELPNLPAGRQQIVLGRYLPEGKDQKGTVIVSGEYKGKRVRYEAAVALQAAESGNAFIPRLWARMHLDALLEQGQTPAVKADIVALSEEYYIMTPYTSFLVLESDTDRERFGVKRRFKMRDGEKFFADGRDAANFQLRQKQMQLAGEWRQDLRRQLLRELMTLGRVLPTAQDGWGAPEHGSRMGIVSGKFRSISDRNGRVASKLSDIGNVNEWDGDSDTPRSRNQPGDRRLLNGAENLGFDGRDADEYFDGEGEKDQEPPADVEIDEIRESENAEPRSEAASYEIRADKLLASKEKDARRAYERPMRPSPVLSPLMERSGLYASRSTGRVRFSRDSLAASGPASEVLKRADRAAWGPGVDGRYRWLNSLFPVLPPAPAADTPLTKSTWPEAARQLAQSLLRQDKLDAMSGGIAIQSMCKMTDARRNQMSGQTVYECLYSPKGWIHSIRPSGGQTIVEWYDGKRRAILAPCYRLGRQRAGVASDRLGATALPLGYYDYSFTSLERNYGNYLPEIQDKGDGTALLILRYPREPNRPNNTNYEIRYSIDTNRHVLVTFETWNDGKLQQRTTYSDFVNVAGSWWAGKVTTVNAEDKETSVTTVSIRPVATEAFEKDLAGQIASLRDALLIDEPLPSLAAARQAAQDKKTSFEHHLALISAHLQTQQNDKAWEDWELARPLVKNQPGLEWLETEMLLLTRRLDEAKQQILQSAKKLAADPAADDLHLANKLYGQASRSGHGNEQLVLLEELKAVYARQPEYLRAMQTFSANYANTLDSVGRPEDALPIRKRFAEENPADIGIQLQYMNALIARRDLEAAWDLIAALLAKPDRWNKSERDWIRSSAAGQFMNCMPAKRWLEFLDGWITDETSNQNAYQYYLSGLLRLNRVGAMRQTMTKWIEEGLAAAADPKSASDVADERRQARTARMRAAVQMALGQGYNSYTDYVDPYWYPLLGQTVIALFADEVNRDLASQIMPQHRFAQTDEARKLRRHFADVLSREVMTLTPQVLYQIVSWIHVDEPKVDKEIWDSVAARLEQRWSKESDSTARNSLAQSLCAVLNKADREVGLLRFLRRQLDEGPKEFTPVHAWGLYSELLGRDWTPAFEEEIFLVLPRISDATNKEQRVAILVPALYQLVDHLIEARVAAGSASPEAKSKMTRPELAAEQSKVRTAAKEGMIERLKKEALRQEDGLRPWLVVERLRLEMQLNKDGRSIAGECWELLPAKPWVPESAPAAPEEVDDDQPDVAGQENNAGGQTPAEKMSAGHPILLDRALTTLACLAARRGAEPELVQKITTYMDAGDEATVAAAGRGRATGDPDADPYWRYQKYRLLVARDEPRELETCLSQWIRPAKADPTWRLALGYLMAEQGRLPEAIAQFTALEKADLLAPKEFRSLADWYIATGQREKCDAALLGALRTSSEQELANRLYGYLQPWQQGDDKMPTELDPEVPRTLTVLLEKAESPANYRHLLAEFYRHSRDFRILRCLADGMIGHTAQQVYPLLRDQAQILNDIRDEATADALLQQIEEVRRRAKTRVDQRALDFLEVQVSRRAAEVRNQPGPHIRKALAALERCFTGEWVQGERRLMAKLLAGLGHIAAEELSREQLRQLKNLCDCRSEPAEDRLVIATKYAETLWAYARRDDALAVLEATLDEYRQEMRGVLPDSADTAVNLFITYLEQTQHFTRGETWLLNELRRPANQQQQYWLTRRLLELYANAVLEKSEVALGKGEALYRAAYAKMLPELERPDRSHRHAVIDLACRLFEYAKRVGIEPREMRAFAFTIFPKVLANETEQNSYHSQISTVANALHNVLNPLTALEFLIERLEQEPEWLRLAQYNSGWHRHCHELGEWRPQASALGALEPRLLKIVIAELRRDLTERMAYNRSMYSRHHSYFWAEKTADFKAAADAVWREQRTSGPTVQYVATYLANNLDDYDRAIEMLLDAHTNGRLEEAGQSLLVSSLHHRGRYAESIPILIGLIDQRPEQVECRALLMVAYYQNHNPEQLKKTLAQADKDFHEGGRWLEGNIGRLARACVDTRLNEDAVKYYAELIPLRKRTLGGRLLGDGTLSEYYRQLALGQSGLGNTIQAVEAASGAIVIWGQDQNSRNNAINVLKDVLRRSQDLAKYVASLEKQVADNGLENPIVRKALGQIYLEQNDYKEAARQFTLALEVQPNDRETLMALVAAYAKLNDAAGAIRQILAAVDLSRRDNGLYANLGDRYTALNNKPQAERAYLSIVEMQPNESESHAILAEIRQKQGRWDEAMHHWRQVIRVRTLEPTGFQRLAEAQIHEKLWKDAVETLATLLKQDWPSRFGDVHGAVKQLQEQVPAEFRRSVLQH